MLNVSFSQNSGFSSLSKGEKVKCSCVFLPFSLSLCDLQAFKTSAYELAVI